MNLRYKLKFNHQYNLPLFKSYDSVINFFNNNESNNLIYKDFYSGQSIRVDITYWGQPIINDKIHDVYEVVIDNEYSGWTSKDFIKFENISKEEENEYESICL